MSHVESSREKGRTIEHHFVYPEEDAASQILHVVLILMIKRSAESFSASFLCQDLKMQPRGRTRRGGATCPFEPARDMKSSDNFRKRHSGFKRLCHVFRTCC